MAGGPPSPFVQGRDAETKQGGEERKAARSEMKTTWKQTTRWATVSQPQSAQKTETIKYKLITLKNSLMLN